MTPNDYEYLRTMLRERSGLVLSDDKQYLLESRLNPVTRANGYESISALVQALRGQAGETLRVAVTDSMTTNETFFFRDKTPFDNFRDTTIPHFLDTRAGDRRLRIWCAAASTGQEPYSLAMEIKEMADKLATWRIEIIATDISADVLEKAKAGMYSQFEVQRGMPIQMLMKYFKQNGEVWQIDSSIRAMVQYRKFNLLDNMRALGTFDIVFCRNVLIYFDQPTKAAVLDRIAAQMKPDGFLALGAAETVIGLTDAFASVPGKRGLYAVKPSEAQRPVFGAGRPAIGLAAAGSR